MLKPNHRSYAKSEELLDRALRSIPLGTQTFSKSHTQYPRGAAPFYIERAIGAHAWDVDGNEYVDFSNALASVTLGHCDPDVTAAVVEQIKVGTIYSLPHPLEIDVSEQIIGMVPCAEQVRFGKNGSDATSGAIRAARAFTGRDHIAVCGYHGWQDWYIGSTTRNKGVPRAIRELTHAFTYNDLDSMHRTLLSRRGEFAAVILEPMNVDFPNPGFLEGVVAMAHEHGALVIFDETITGFRYANGGAQQLFGVTPDIASFGKGIANGYPLSAVTGRADVMQEFSEIFFSFTMGGETLSLAAARATLNKLQRENVTDRLAATGKKVTDTIKALIVEHGCESLFEVKGHPSWSFLIFRDVQGVPLWPIKTLWMQEMLGRGVLSTTTHNISYAHDDVDVAHLCDAYDEVLPLIRSAVETGDVQCRLRCKALEPLFKVR